jgi:hypothetical protein
VLISHFPCVCYALHWFHSRCNHLYCYIKNTNYEPSYVIFCSLLLLCSRSLFPYDFDFIFYWKFNGKKLNSMQKCKTAYKLSVWNMLTFAGHCTPTTQKIHVRHCRKMRRHMEGRVDCRIPAWKDSHFWDVNPDVTCRIHQPWPTSQHRSRAVKVRSMALNILILAAASFVIPTGMLGWGSPGIINTVNSYNWNEVRNGSQLVNQ